MNGAELKTIRESLGLSLQWLANKVGVTHRSAAYWEAGSKIPDDVIKLVLSLEASVNNAVDNGLISIVDATENQQGLPDRIVLVRYKTDQDLWRFRKDMSGLPASYHAAILYRLRTEITKLGTPCHVIWFDPARYAEWLGDREDSEAMRSAWAGQV